MTVTGIPYTLIIAVKRDKAVTLDGSTHLYS